MRICLTELQPFQNIIGGGTTHIIDLSKALTVKGHDVFIVTSKPGDEKERLEVYEGVKVINVGIPHKVFKREGFFRTTYNLGYRFLWELSWIIGARRAIKKIKPEVCNPQSSITTALPAILSGIPTVITQQGVHGEGFREIWSKRGSKVVVWLSKIYGSVEKFNTKRAKGMTCVSKPSYDYYGKFVSDKIKDNVVIIPHGVDPDNFPSKKNYSKKKDYLFVGRLTEQKGAPYLIDALEILDKKKIKITVNIAGNGSEDYVKPLKEKASKFKYVKANFLGFVTGKEKFDLYNKSAIFITPSVFEPFGIVLTEAMASGCAMISANHDGGKLLVKPSYGVVINFDKESERAKNLANAIEKSTKWDIKKMGPSAVKASERYYYTNLAEEYLNVYEKAITKSK